MRKEESFSEEPEESIHEVQQGLPVELPEIVALFYEQDAFVEKVYTAWCKQFHQIPGIYIRGDVDFIEPASKPEQWKKKRTVDLKEWHKVKKWEHGGTGRMLIDYTFTRGPSQSQPQPQTKEQWVRPLKLFASWPYVQIRPDPTVEEDMIIQGIHFPQKGLSKRAAANLAFLTEQSSGEADGFHFTVEGKSLSRPDAAWERIEQSWEHPYPFVAHWQVEAVARTLALHADGERAYRVVDPGGKVLQVFWVKKILSVLEESQEGERLEDVPGGFDAPTVAEVLEDSSHRNRVFLPTLDPSKLSSSDALYHHS